MHHAIKVATAGTVALVLFSACATTAAERVAAVIDTLPSGIVRVTSDKPVGWSDSSRAWKFAEVRHYGTAEGPGELIEPGNLGVDGAGRLYVVDTKPAVIKVYDSAGAFLRTIGREGSGPGEFKVGFMAVRGSHVVIHDPMQRRTSVFDTAGTYLTSWQSSCCYWDDVSIDRHDRVYIPTFNPPDSAGKSRGRAFTRYTLEGKLIDTLFVALHEDQAKRWQFRKKGKDGKSMSSMSSSVPFTPVPVQTFHPDGGFLTAWSADYRIIRSPRGSDTTRIISRSWTSDLVPTVLRQAKVDEMVKSATNMVGESEARAAVRLDDVPTKAPPFTELTLDGAGYLWARHLIGSDSTQTTYDIFNPIGAWLGTLRVPRAVQEFSGHLITATDLYTAGEGDDGRPVIVRLKIIR